MNSLIGMTLGLLVNATLWVATVEKQVPSVVGAPATKSLCEALQAIKPGQQLPITLSGVYAVNYETQVFYDPKQPLCEEDVQPSTWVEFNKATGEIARLDAIIGKNRRASVKFEGVLFGPRPLEPDNPALPDAMSLPDRMRNRRYGHQNKFRTKFVVIRVLKAELIPESAPWNLVWFVPESSKCKLETPLNAEVPSYPESARLAWLEGEVDVEVKVQSGRVAATRVVSGDRALGEATVKNIHTWIFPPDVNDVFITHFVYALEVRKSGDQKGSKIKLELPLYVRITAPRIDW